jgi:hypothetical protein
MRRLYLVPVGIGLLALLALIVVLVIGALGLGVYAKVGW